jgi:hypothetical protein
MEVRVDEAAFSGPSVKDRLTHNWNDAAKRTYRWTSTAMLVDAGTSTRLMTISAAMIGEGVPLLERGDIVDVYVVLQGIDYSRGRAPVVVRRGCSVRDERCLDGLRKKQEGRVAGVAIGSDYSVASDKRFAKPPGNLSCVLQKVGCSGELAAVLR